MCSTLLKDIKNKNKKLCLIVPKSEKTDLIVKIPFKK